MSHTKRIQKTEDGWPTFFVPEIDESYHSNYGARTESRHIYIDQALAQTHKPEPLVLDVGFGTGLNAFETYLYAEKHRQKTIYYTIEKHILTAEEIASLKINTIVTKQEFTLFKQLHDCAWNTTHELSPYFVIHKISGDITTCEHIPYNIDVIYFDAFSPSKEEGLWSKAVFTKLHKHMSPESLLTTYCVKGDVKRTLKSCGFSIEKIPGPPEGKREILRAKKI
ncbi:MAG: tRNA (5-methylaminomethyl-2-thiouridine)(34)-methyltransferase MnmD [Bacteroidales bacterium]|jgi:tRNA U34 5-methylaminomethyl-2-thiouridine-forming methyltransferase MnmC|nr:tRNA (5-methylaminomethyl-2-thiouridine)(34)-methyltransferase MnmD [Bacteroidales bacterium]